MAATRIFPSAGCTAIAEALALALCIGVLTMPLVPNPKSSDPSVFWRIKAIELRPWETMRPAERICPFGCRAFGCSATAFAKSNCPTLGSMTTIPPADPKVGSRAPVVPFKRSTTMPVGGNGVLLSLEQVASARHAVRVRQKRCTAVPFMSVSPERSLEQMRRPRALQFVTGGHPSIQSESASGDMSTSIQTVLIYGYGVMGRGVAKTFADAGFTTLVKSRRAQQLAELPVNVMAAERLPEKAPDLVIEFVPEDPKVKQAVYAELEAAYADGTPLIASGTSGLDLVEL